MLYSVMGSQGSGKSTILNALRNERGFPCISRKSSRSILSDWGVTLEDVNTDADLTIRFQEEIIQRKAEDESPAAMASEVWFTERTYADLFTYALVSLGNDSYYSDWLNQYYRKCAKLQQTYVGVFYLKGGLFPVQNDGTRNANPHFSTMVDVTMWQFASQMTVPSVLMPITTVDLDARVDFISNATIQRSFT